MIVSFPAITLVHAQTPPSPVVISQPFQTTNANSTVYQTYFRNPADDPHLSQAQLIAALRQRVKYVFVLFQENRSFDSYFGSFPGANGLFSDGVSPRSAAFTPGFVQPLAAAGTGAPGTIQPFLIGQAHHAADTDDIDHNHARMAAKMNLGPSGAGTPRMDMFALTEELKYSPAGLTAPTLQGKQFGELAMAYEDCNTIPFLWNYAARFTLFDNIFQTTVGPSSPNAIAMLAGQSGDTQYIKHPDAAGTLIPMTGDELPFWGSAKDTTATDSTNPVRQPANTKRENQAASNIEQNLTFASLPLTLAGGSLATLTQSDTAAATDLADVQQDVPYIANLGRKPFAWRWYEEGYDHEPTDPTATASHTAYIGHHSGPQYFGYITNNSQMNQNMRGLADFFTDIGSNNLPAGGGLIYVRGGYTNQGGPNETSLPPYYNPANFPGNAEAAKVQTQFLGDDDHPAYSDSELSEALVAREVNAIAQSPYWGQSAIIITYDESEGDYDHVAPRILSYDQNGLPLSRGPRIPLILISPFARAHATSREEGDHNSVIGLIDSVFDLPPLADLPDELQARITGQQAQFNGPGGFVQTNRGPHDDQTPGTGKLLSGFDPSRLLGTAPPIPASYAMIAPAAIATLPHFGGQGCQALGITTEETITGYSYPIPTDFNPRPSTYPGTPTYVGTP